MVFLHVQADTVIVLGLERNLFIAFVGRWWSQETVVPQAVGGAVDRGKSVERDRHIGLVLKSNKDRYLVYG